MHTATETNIPIYSLEQASRDGSALFAVMDSNEGLSAQQKELFFVPHRQNYYKLVLVKVGGSRHWVDMVPYNVRSNTLYISTPRQVLLKEEADMCFEGISISFTEEFLNMEENRALLQLPIISDQQNGHEIELAEADVAFIDDMTTKIQAEYRQQHDHRNSMLLAYLRILLIHASRLYMAQYPNLPENKQPDLLKRFNDLITENFATCHDVAVYAERLHLTPAYFSTLIKQQSGKTPLELLHERQLLEAKRLLFHTELSAKEIAYQLGFEDVPYFNRFFKRLAGTTPVAYRKHIRKMHQ